MWRCKLASDGVSFQELRLQANMASAEIIARGKRPYMAKFSHDPVEKGLQMRLPDCRILERTQLSNWVVAQSVLGRVLKPGSR